MKSKTPDAWLTLVLKTMSSEELRKESENPSNSSEEREFMRQELRRRK